MSKILIFICSIISILFALMLSAWIQRKTSNESDILKAFHNMIRKKASDFIKAEYIVLLATSIPVAIILGFFVGWPGAIFFGVGVLLSLPIIVFGIHTSNVGTIKASKNINNGNFPSALRVSFRSGSVMGFYISGFGLLAFAVIFLFFNFIFISKYIMCYALGAVFVSLFISVSGRTYSKASNLYYDDESVDNTGAIAGAGADYYALFVFAVASAISLADVAVNTGGVTSTFTSVSSSLFPLSVAGIGIISSLFLSLLYRGTNKKNNARDINLINFINGLIVVLGATYLSNNLMQSYRYAFAVGSGIAAGVLIGIITEHFAYDNLKFTRKYDRLRDKFEETSTIREVTMGGQATVAITLVLCTGLVVAYNFANIYGVALSAVGFLSLSGSVIAPEIFSSVISNVSRLTKSDENEDERGIDLLLEQVQLKVSAVSRGYLQTAMSLVSVSGVLLMIYLTKNLTMDFVTQFVMAGIFTGAMIAYFYTSILSNSVLLIANYDTSKSEKEAFYDRISVSIKGLIIITLFATVGPIGIGILFGLNFLIGTLFGMILMGFLLNSFFDNSGRKYQNVSGISLNSIICVMVIVSVTFASLLMEHGSFFLR